MIVHLSCSPRFGWHSFSRIALARLAIGIAAVPALAACGSQPAPEATASEMSPEEQAAAAKAQAKADRDAKLASFYGGDAPADEDGADKKDDKEKGGSSTPSFPTAPPVAGGNASPSQPVPMTAGNSASNSGPGMGAGPPEPKSLPAPRVDSAPPPSIGKVQ